jgi:hypothetical protein
VYGEVLQHRAVLGGDRCELVPRADVELPYGVGRARHPQLASAGGHDHAARGADGERAVRRRRTLIIEREPRDPQAPVGGEELPALGIELDLVDLRQLVVGDRAIEHEGVDLGIVVEPLDRGAVVVALKIPLAIPDEELLRFLAPSESPRIVYVVRVDPRHRREERTVLPEVVAEHTSPRFGIGIRAVRALGDEQDPPTEVRRILHGLDIDVFGRRGHVALSTDQSTFGGHARNRNEESHHLVPPLRAQRAAERP